MDATTADVAILHWPAEEDRRVQLAGRHHPRLLLVEPDHTPPLTADPLEDWIRTPAPEADHRARREALRRRAGLHGTDSPTIDDSGVVRMGDRWVGVPPVEARLVTLLIDRYGAVCSRDELGDVAWPDEDVQRNALDVRILRLRRRLDRLGLVIRTVRARGYLLEEVRWEGSPFPTR